MAPTVYQQQLLTSFIDDIADGTTVKLAPTLSCHSVWLSQIASRLDISPSLTWAIRAISLSQLGRSVQDRNLIHNSRNMYGKALLKLNKALQDPVAGVSSDTLSATVLLSFYELLNCTEQNSWIRHAGGAANLMRLRGPERHRTGFDRAVFLASRHAFVLQAFSQSEECFLNTPPWRKLSLEIAETSPRSPFNDTREEYFQELITLPGWKSEAMAYLQEGSQDREVVEDLVRRGHTHRSNWKAIWARVSDALREAGQGPTTIASPSNDKLFPNVYEYPSANVASYYCSYNAILSVLNVLLIGLEAKLSSLATSQQSSRQSSEARDSRQVSPLADAATDAARVALNIEGPGKRAFMARTIDSLPERFSSPELWSVYSSRGGPSTTTAAASPKDFPTMSAGDTISRRSMYLVENINCAREICKSVEDVEKSVFLGPLFLIFCLKTALRILRSPEEYAWILNKLERLGKRLGVAQVVLGADGQEIIP